MEDDRRMLRRIVALLFAFAGLAQRLCDLPWPARGLAFWALRTAEAIAREFALEAALDQGASVALPVLTITAVHSGQTPADAMRLAQSFRALARLLDRMADGNPRRRDMCIARLCAGLAACAASPHLLAGTRFERSSRCLAAPGFAIERRDSS